MRVTFWLSAAAIFYTFMGYPAIMWALARLRPKRCRIAPIAPAVSVVMAVHNGASLLPRKMEHLFRLDYANLNQIIVVSDGCTDGGAEYLAQLRHPLLKVILFAHQSGKAAAVNAGMAWATSDIILFVDIRPETAPGTIQRMVSHFADPEVGCVAGELLLVDDDHDEVSQAVGGLYWRYEQWIRHCESVYDSPVGVYGGCYAVRRELADPQPDGMILDDMFQPLSIIRKGFRSVLGEGAYAYDKWPKNAADEFRRKVRTVAGNFQLFQLAPWTLSPRNRVFFQLISHKVMRLVVPYLMILSLVSASVLASESHLYAIFAIVQLLGLAFALAGLRGRIPVLGRPAAVAGALLMLNCAAVVGLFRFLFTRGPLWKIWTAQTQGLSSVSAPLPDPEPPEPSTSTNPTTSGLPRLG